jgi:hypothetical protein
MKTATIYERRGVFYIRSSSETTAGIWVDDGDCYSISIDSDYDKIGKYVFTI